MWGRAGDSNSEAQFAFRHPSATFWSCTRPKIKVQFGPGYLGAVHLLSKLGHDINYHKKSKKIITYQILLLLFS